MYKIRINMDTQSDVMKVVELAVSMGDKTTVYLEDNSGHCVNAKSLLGVMYGSVEFTELYLKSDSDKLGNVFREFMI